MARISAAGLSFFITFFNQSQHAIFKRGSRDACLKIACFDWLNLEPGLNPEILSISLDHNELFYGNESEQIDVLKYNHNFLLSLLHELFLRL